MTTKEQERKALAKIRKIVEELGENSYVGTAFEGCFEKAEENIEYDFGCSLKQENDELEYKIKQYKSIRDELVEENGKLKRSYESLTQDCLRLREKTCHDLCEAHQNAKTLKDMCTEAEAKNAELEAQVKAQAQMILELKARLYDYMVK